MGSEGSFWLTLDKNMGKKNLNAWVAERVENPIGPGTPDVFLTMTESGSMHWIELKHAHFWPKRPDTPLRIDHYTVQQQNWLKRHADIGANTWLFIQVDKDYLLFAGKDAKIINNRPKAELLAIAVIRWEGRVNYQEMKDFLNWGDI